MTTGSKPYITGKNGRSSNYGFFKESRTENQGTRCPRSVLKFTSDRGLHPTQKPVALIEYLIRTYTEPDAIILDCCAGSGSTAVAAINTGRQYIAIERDEIYHALVEKRLADATSSEAPLPQNWLPEAVCHRLL